mmetsp:Transcript_18565/g.71652  ORF Transcript_18565/g.71652 Transcript_18565/m.71652 type:complete len:451 (-) Transcript_18565:288-1640(-)
MLLPLGGAPGARHEILAGDSLLQLLSYLESSEAAHPPLALVGHVSCAVQLELGSNPLRSREECGSGLVGGLGRVCDGRAGRREFWQLVGELVGRDALAPRLLKVRVHLVVEVEALPRDVQVLREIPADGPVVACKHDADVVLGLHLQAASVGYLRLLQQAQAVLHDAHHVLRLCKLWPELGRHLEVGQCFVVKARAVLGSAAEVVRLVVVLVERQRLGVESIRLCEAAELLVCLADVQERFLVPRIQLHCLPQSHQSLVGLADSGQADACVVPVGRVALVEADGLLEVLEGAVVVPLLVVDEATLVEAVGVALDTQRLRKVCDGVVEGVVGGACLATALPCFVAAYVHFDGAREVLDRLVQVACDGKSSAPSEEGAERGRGELGNEGIERLHCRHELAGVHLEIASRNALVHLHLAYTVLDEALLRHQSAVVLCRSHCLVHNSVSALVTH